MSKTPYQTEIDNIINLYKNKKFIEARDHALKITKKFPDFYYGWKALGIILKQIGNISESLRVTKKAIRLNPKDPELYFNLANIFLLLKKFLDSKQCYEKAIKLNPNYAEAYNNLGITLRELENLDDSEKALRKSIEIDQNYSDAYINLSKTLYLKKNFKSAFELSEWRWEKDYLIGKKIVSSRPIWNGQRNSKILVWKEQGIGDEIMLFSMLAELRLVSKKIIVYCDKRLIPLLSRSFSKDIIYHSNIKNISEDDYDTQISVGSLLQFFRTDLNSFKISAKGYLKSDEEKTKKIKKKLKKNCDYKIIGISWKTYSNLRMASYRNILLKDLVDIFNKKNVKLINLQYGEVSNEINFVKKQMGIEILDLKEIDKKNDLDSLASLISACDLVISIDNLTVHLAGSLGISTKLLLPYNMDTRWGLERNKSFLYDSVNIYRQTKLGDWSEILKQIKSNF